MQGKNTTGYPHTHSTTVTLSYCVTPAAAEVKSALRGERGKQPKKHGLAVARKQYSVCGR